MLLWLLDWKSKKVTSRCQTHPNCVKDSNLRYQFTIVLTNWTIPIQSRVGIEPTTHSVRCFFGKPSETSKSSWTVQHHSQLRNEYYNSAIQKHPTRLVWYFLFHLLFVILTKEESHNLSKSINVLLLYRHFECFWLTTYSFFLSNRLSQKCIEKLLKTITSLFWNKDFKTTTQLFCAVKIILGLSNEQLS